MQGVARLGALTSPWTWIGALLVAAALAVLGHTSAEAAGDDPHSDQPGLLASVAATADGIGGASPLTAPVAGALRQVPAVDAVSTGSLLPAVAPLAGDQPLVRDAIAPLRPALTAVGGALPAPVVGVAHDVVGSLPETVAAAPAVESPAPRPEPAMPAAAGAMPARVWRSQPQLLLADPTAQALPRTAPAGATPPDPNAPWTPGLPSLPPGAPGTGGLAALTAGLVASVAWVAVLTLLLALVVLARARMAAPLALRSAMHASRMRRPG
ncbi:MAG: hypothetical protein E6J41_17945 [Chloroflexi bacterium]|nr:MAG: hypothetical protein E6J41_17945 [Chloroflexota bacterium]